MKTVWNLIGCLPDLIALLQSIQKKIDEGQVDGKVKDNVKTIHEAFNAKDSAKLNETFNSR